MGPTSQQGDLDRRIGEVEALRRRILNVIPHALRTPITTFRGLAEALPHASPDDVRDRLAPALRRLAAQAEHLLDDMLLAAGITTTLPTGPPEAVAVLAAARRVWAELPDDQQEAGKLVVEGDEAVAALAPPGSLFKILLHLLDNATKYGTSPTTVRAKRIGTTVTVEVESTGAVGKDLTATGDRAAPSVDLLFQPFFRGEAAVMRGPGLGVGLTVARALAEHAGGSIELDAAPDSERVVARVHLPVAL